jgi:hypothetical protein
MNSSFTAKHCLVHESVLRECVDPRAIEDSPLGRSKKMHCPPNSSHFVDSGDLVCEDVHQFVMQAAYERSLDTSLNRSIIRLPVSEGGMIVCHYMNELKPRLFSRSPLMMSIVDSSTGELSNLESIVFYGHSKGIKEMIANRARLNDSPAGSVRSFRTTEAKTALEVCFERPISIGESLLALAAFAIDYLKDYPAKLNTLAGFTFQNTLSRPETTIKNGRAVRCVFTQVSRDEYFGPFSELSN